MPSNYAYYHMTVAVSSDTVIGNLLMRPNSGINEISVQGSACFIAPTSMPIRCTGDVIVFTNCNQSASHLITGIELCGTGDQTFVNNNRSAGVGWVDAIPVILNKASGSVNICNGAVAAANLTHDVLTLAAKQPCEALAINDATAANLTFLSLGPIRISGVVETETLNLTPGLSATYPTVVEIPDSIPRPQYSDGNDDDYGIMFSWNCKGAILHDGEETLDIEYFNNNQGMSATVPAIRLIRRNGATVLSNQVFHYYNSSAGFAAAQPDYPDRWSHALTLNGEEVGYIAIDMVLRTIVLTYDSATETFDFPERCRLSSEATVWGTNTLITGADSDSDSVRDSFGIYETSCTDGIQDDSDDPNYQVDEQIIRACLIEPVPVVIPPVIQFVSGMSLPQAASADDSPVRLAEFNAHAVNAGLHLPTGNIGTLLVMTESGPAFRTAAIVSGSVTFN